MREKQIAVIFLEIFLIVVILALLLAVVIPEVFQLIRKGEPEPPEETVPSSPAAMRYECQGRSQPGQSGPESWLQFVAGCS
jgi:hypothetical protein